MNNEGLQLIVEIRCKPGAEDEIERRVVDFLEATRAEPGCRAASFHRVEEDADRFVLLAEFADERALQAHFDATWRQRIADELPPLLVERPRRFTLRRVA